MNTYHTTTFSKIELTLRRFAYKFVTGLMKFLMKIAFKYKVDGSCNIPKKGGVLFAANHASFIDPVAVSIGTNKHLSFVAREDLFHIPIFGSLISFLGTYPIKRESSDPSGIKTVITLLKQKDGVLLFPEGTRTHSGELQKGQGGVGFLVLKAGVPVVPVLISGTWNVWGRYRRFPKKGEIFVRFGKPLTFQSSGKAGKEEYHTIVDRIMREIFLLKGVEEKKE